MTELDLINVIAAGGPTSFLCYFMYRLERKMDLMLETLIKKI